VTLLLQGYVPAPVVEPAPAGETLVLMASVQVDANVLALTGPA
jgi:hypothetical protein